MLMPGKRGCRGQRRARLLGSCPPPVHKLDGVRKFIRRRAKAGLRVSGHGWGHRLWFSGCQREERDGGSTEGKLDTKRASSSLEGEEQREVRSRRQW